MKNNKKKFRLGDITKVVSGGTPSTKKSEYYENGYISWITPKDLSGYKFKYISCGERSITEEGMKNSSAKILPKGTVLFSSRAPIGYVAIAENELCTNQGFKSFICDSNYIHNEYLYYYLIANKERITSLANGSTFKELSLTSAQDIIVEIPDLDEQIRISNILSNIDSKIQLNYEIINNIELLAQEVYKHWFEDFKYEEIPSEWKWVSIENAVEIIGGGTPKTSEESYWSNGNINWFTPSDLTSIKLLFIDFSSKKINENGLKNSSAKLIPPYSLLMTSRATIGELAINQNIVTTNQGIVSFIPNDNFSIYQLYFWAKLNKDKIISIANGSTFKEVSKVDLKKLKIIQPTNAEQFNENMSYYFNKIEQLINETAILQRTLEYLILKLIN